jgi:predicted TIM-barrel fold metal-dependent hydrolase
MATGHFRHRIDITRRSLLAAAAALPARLSGAQASPPVIDAHCHAGLGETMTAPYTTRNDVDVTLRHMEEAGIGRTVIFPLINPTYEKANQEIADLCGRHPGKFIGFAKHDPETEAGRIRAMLRHEVESLGLKGLKLHKQPTREILDAVAEFGIPILYHPKEIAMFYPAADGYPQIPLIMAHLGSFESMNWNWHLEAIEIAKKHANVYLETSAVVAQQFLELAAKELGPDKLIFGSDGPDHDSRLELYKVRLLKLPAEAEAKVLGGNIARWLPKGSL